MKKGHGKKNVLLTGDWFDHIVLQTFDDDQWIENFRMKRETFASLCRDLEAILAPSDHAVRDVVDIQKQVAITLYWLASSAQLQNYRQFIWSRNVDGLQYSS